MKLDFDESDGTSVVTGDTTLTHYPNGSYTVSLKGVYSIISYRVQFMDENDDYAEGNDMIYLSHDGQEYRVYFIYTHDGLSLIYKE
jgi:hypothetical protein